MYNAVLPSYDYGKKGGDKDGKHINASDPQNKEEVHKLLFG